MAGGLLGGFDEHPVEIIRNSNRTYEVKGTKSVQIKQPKGCLDQRQCSGLLTGLDSIIKDLNSLII